MKPKVTKTISIALLLSIGVHLILISVLIGLHKSKSRLIKDVPYLEISNIPSQRALRTFKRKRIISPRLTPVKQKQIEAKVNTPVDTIPKKTTIIHRNPSTTLRGFSLPKPHTLTIDNVGLDSPFPSFNDGIAGGFTYGRISLQRINRRSKPEPIKPPIDDSIQGLGELPLPNVILARIGQHIVTNRTKDIVDIVFIIDGSGSMKDNINSVRKHLNRMTELFDDAEIDFTIGIAIFRHSTAYNMLGWDFEVVPQTRSISQIKRALGQVKCRGGEKAVDALIRAADEVNYRKNADVHFILITDEYVSGNYSASDVLKKMNDCKIKVDVVGLDEPFQKFITRTTGGIWLPISSLGVH